MYGRSILTVLYSRTVPITEEDKVVFSVIGASHQSLDIQIQQRLILPGVVVAEATVTVVVVEDAANTADVVVAIVLDAPVTTHEQTADTMVLG